VKDFFYHVPATLQEALALLGPAVRGLAGGTDLVTLMKAGLAEPRHVVTLRRVLPKGIVEETEALALGAATTLNEIEESALLQNKYAALAQSARLAASAQLRAMATIGGNLLQRPRCWYFRNPHARCWLKGGDACPARDGENRQHAIFGDSPCVAVHPSDPACALLAFDASVRVAAPRGERTVPLEKFFALPDEARRTETVLSHDELILELRMPSHPEETRSVYLKAMDRRAFSFALVGVAAVLRLSSRARIGHARVVLGGVAPIPWRSRAAEEVLLGSTLSEALLEKAAQAAVGGAAALRDNAWKIPLAKALVARALRQLVRS
jgi:xanthine dehydrogenase YagS FAD-binding subunit